MNSFDTKIIQTLIKNSDGLTFTELKEKTRINQETLSYRLEKLKKRGDLIHKDKKYSLNLDRKELKELITIEHKIYKKYEEKIEKLKKTRKPLSVGTALITESLWNHNKLVFALLTDNISNKFVKERGREYLEHYEKIITDTITILRKIDPTATNNLIDFVFTTLELQKVDY